MLGIMIIVLGMSNLSPVSLATKYGPFYKPDYTIKSPLGYRLCSCLTVPLSLSAAYVSVYEVLCYSP